MAPVETKEKKTTKVNFTVNNVKKINSDEAFRLLSSAGKINRGLGNQLRTKINDQITANNTPCLIELTPLPGQDLNQNAAKHLAFQTNTWLRDEVNLQFRVRFLFDKNAFLLVTVKQYEQFSKA
jgi:hypothetical protein